MCDLGQKIATSDIALLTYPIPTIIAKWADFGFLKVQQTNYMAHIFT